jgi:hypothetical protein
MMQKFHRLARSDSSQDAIGRALWARLSSVCGQKGHPAETFTHGTSMKLLFIDSLNLAATVEPLAPWPGQRAVRNEGHHSAELLQCTQPDANDEAPDSRYWTAYDHFMLEREARARRREYVYGLIAKAWRALVERRARGGASPRRPRATAGTDVPSLWARTATDAHQRQTVSAGD